MAEASTVYLQVSSELASVYLGQEQVMAEAAPVNPQAGPELASAIPWVGRAGG
jgi:hypothetical protein